MIANEEFSDESLFDEDKNYVQRRWPSSAKRLWTFSIQKKKLDDKAKRGEFYLVAICGYRDSQEKKVFAIPYSYLCEHILPHPNLVLRSGGGYSFNVSGTEGNYKFNWTSKIPMEGTKFLKPSVTIESSQTLISELEKEIEKGSNDYRIDSEIESIISSELLIEEKRNLRYHLAADRNPRLAKEAKRIHGYACQVCGFNFERDYGELGHGYIEAHHLTPFAQLPPNNPARLSPSEDFRVLCSNCHRMMHRHGTTPLFEDFVRLYQKQNGEK